MVDRFVGKMHKKMIEERKKSETNLLKNVGGGSRRSSISPSTETIKETKETRTTKSKDGQRSLSATPVGSSRDLLQIPNIDLQLQALPGLSLQIGPGVDLL